MIQIAIFKLIIGIALLFQGASESFDVQNWVGVLLLADGIAGIAKSINNTFKGNEDDFI